MIQILCRGRAVADEEDDSIVELEKVMFFAKDTQKELAKIVDFLELTKKTPIKNHEDRLENFNRKLKET